MLGVKGKSKSYPLLLLIFLVSSGLVSAVEDSSEVESAEIETTIELAKELEIILDDQTNKMAKQVTENFELKLENSEKSLKAQIEASEKSVTNTILLTAAGTLLIYALVFEVVPPVFKWIHKKIKSKKTEKE